ncbi:hypothetical protein OPTIMUS_144 [Mycobacterium phage Optimus]|uniref:Uncharacterized protein n=2 Tax=Omegavirus TaxID=1623292 RepID=Q854A9_BPMOM|nr:gp157 [Mycobacterium phage Omega]YP_009591000.1 hypothetical protein FDG54_gp144 [Mycobacterium phage Optimus]AAN12799.1 hypothetical protein PBI_OMEGA_157 [Mycobacterium phage Omega]AEJ92200.1 hypothetical protein OPTIMUS_144 [Mycobacterium phage Optimus]
MKTSEFVASARDEIYQGWTKNSYRNDQGVCILGALDRVALHNLHLDTEETVKARAKAEAEIKKMAEELFPDIWSGDIPALNDNWSTTKDDVLNLLDKTTIGLEERGE